MYVLFAFLCNSSNFQYLILGESTLVLGRSYTGCELHTCMLPRVVDVSSLSSPFLQVNNTFQLRTTRSLDLPHSAS